MIIACASLWSHLTTVRADERQFRHASSLFGDPKYPEDFAHFDYVNPQAPKGGQARLASITRFDSLNKLPERGTVAPGLAYIYDTLMAPSYDEPSTEYGLLAADFWYPEDYSSVVYRLRPEATWHDGTPITVDDVLWSFEKTVELQPYLGQYYSSVSSVEQTGPHEVTFTFDQVGNRELPKIVGQLEIFPKHWWTATGPDGEPRDIAQSTLEIPLGSGPYRIRDFEAGRTITYERVDDYWAKDLNVNVGKYNFDELTYVIFFDSTVLREAFKAGEFDFRDENSSSKWATAYQFPAVDKGDVIKETFPDEARGYAQGYGLNLRLEKFQDPRVRRALSYAWDFETINKSISFGLLTRVDSYFHGSELASSGLPAGLELDILETVRDLVPASVFTEVFENPVGGSQEAMRRNLREALTLFRAAGYELKDGVMVNKASGEPFTFEFLTYSQLTERSVLPLQQELEKIGIKTTFRVIDIAQYTNRLRSFDYEVTVVGWGQSLSPGNEQRGYWGSAAADQPGSRNYLGIKDPAIDQLIERVIYANDRAELVAATRALDRVLLHNHYMIPQFTTTEHRTIRWNRFGRPETIPLLTYGFPTIWWYDEQKAASIGTGD